MTFIESEIILNIIPIIYIIGILSIIGFNYFFYKKKTTKVVDEKTKTPTTINFNTGALNQEYKVIIDTTKFSSIEINYSNKGMTINSFPLK
jgi:hypothetical protein